ncbi:hypothetical protein EMCRGX_G016359 [Ephydatia muelleri]
MQGVLPLKPLSNQKSSQTVVDMFTGSHPCVQHSSHSLDYGSVDQLLPLLDDGLLVGQVAKKGSTRRQVSVLSSWMEAWNILHSDCAQTALELVKYQHIICQLFAPDGSSLEAVVENTLPRPGHVLHQWPRDLQRVHTTLCPVNSHHSTNSKLTPLYDQLAHTTLQPASSHHFTTSKLTPLCNQRAHTTLQPANSHHSTTSELTPLYDQRAHTTLRPASSHHSTTSELTPLYDQRAHTTYDQRAHTTL